VIASIIMTAEDFRRIALSLPGAIEKSHMHHPDFRAAGKVFATLGYPNAEVGMAKLTPEQQNNFVQADPAAFAPVNGAWGLKGATHVRLKAAKKTMVRKALAEAWRNVTSSAGTSR
jgi:hypothetical protein